MDQGRPSILLCGEQSPLKNISSSVAPPPSNHRQPAAATCQSWALPCFSKTPVLVRPPPHPPQNSRRRHIPDQHARQHVVPHPSSRRCNSGVVHQIPSTRAIQRINTSPTPSIKWVANIERRFLLWRDKCLCSVLWWLKDEKAAQLFN